LAEDGRAFTGAASHVHPPRQREREDSQVLAALLERLAAMVVLAHHLVTPQITYEDHLLLISKHKSCSPVPDLEILDLI